MFISIGAGYDLPEENDRHTRAERGMAVVDDLNLKLQARYHIVPNAFIPNIPNVPNGTLLLVSSVAFPQRISKNQP